MTFLQSLILGIIQGLTEFLPISSSAHLVLVPYLLNWNIPETQIFPFDVLVQLGTLVAVIIYFWKDLLTILKAFIKGLVQRKPFEDPNARLGWYLILATIPAGIAGILLKSVVEAAFNSPRITAYFLIGTAVMLCAAEFFSRRNRKMIEIKWLDALWMGLFQAVSIFPGISRSGSTITGGMTRNLDRPSAARFSFLMSIPVMLGAGAVSILDLFEIPNLGSFLPVLALGFVVALVVGYLSIEWMLSFVKKHSLVYFAVYCVLFAIAIIITGSVRAETIPQTSEQTPALVQTVDAPAAAAQATFPVITNVEYTASLDWMVPVMSSCANITPGFSIVTHLVPGSQMQPSEGAVLLRWGEPPELADYSAQLAENHLVMIVNPENPLTSLTPALFRQIAEGKISNWNAVFQQCPDCFESQPSGELGNLSPVLNFYQAGEEVQDMFERQIMDGAPVARAAAALIPSSLSMKQAVTQETAAIGYIPSGAVDSSVKAITLSGLEESRLTMPILAITNSEPQGVARGWLLCVQQSI